MTFEEIYDQNFRYVYNVIYMRVMHRETAEDLAAETFAKAFKSFESYDPERAQPVTWLCAIAVNEVKSYFRKASTTRELMTDEIPETPTGDDEGERVRTLAINREAERILSALDDDERELVSLRLSAGLSFREIADLLGISEKAATERYRRLIAKCRKFTEGRKMEDYL